MVWEVTGQEVKRKQDGKPRKIFSLTDTVMWTRERVLRQCS